METESMRHALNLRANAGIERYLVVAQRTATSPELIQTIKSLANVNGASQFTLLIPASPPPGSMMYEEAQIRGRATFTGEEARSLLRAQGVQLESVKVGDMEPLLAIEDELRENPGVYTGLVLSTLPPGLSRWLRLDIHKDAEKRFGLPMIHVVAANPVLVAQPIA